MQRELQALKEDLILLGGKRAHMDGAYDKLSAKFTTTIPTAVAAPYSAFDDEFLDFCALVRRKYPRWMK